MWEAPGGSAVKNLPAMQETWVQSLEEEDPLEKDMSTHPVFLPGKTYGQRNLWPTAHQVSRVGHNLATKPPPPFH